MQETFPCNLLKIT